MVRHKARTDMNQKEIVDELRKEGFTVQSLASIGGGCPDLLVGLGGVNVLLEVKDMNRPHSIKCATPPQRQWMMSWRGQVQIVYSPEEAIEVCKSHLKRTVGAE